MKKVSKQREYAAMLRSQHSTMRKQEERKGSTQLPVKPKHVKEAEMKRQAVSEAACTCMIMIRSEGILLYSFIGKYMGSQ